MSEDNVAGTRVWDPGERAVSIETLPYSKCFAKAL